MMMIWLGERYIMHSLWHAGRVSTLWSISSPFIAVEISCHKTSLSDWMSWPNFDRKDWTIFENAIPSATASGTVYIMYSRVRSMYHGNCLITVLCTWPHAASKQQQMSLMLFVSWETNFTHNIRAFTGALTGLLFKFESKLSVFSNDIDISELRYCQ